MGCNNANKNLPTRHRYFTAESIAVLFVRRNTSPIRAPTRHLSSHPSQPRDAFSGRLSLGHAETYSGSFLCQVLLSVPPQ
jgi:hypothetical protein